jgi:hypothetical protein
MSSNKEIRQLLCGPGHSGRMQHGVSTSHSWKLGYCGLVVSLSQDNDDSDDKDSVLASEGRRVRLTETITIVMPNAN